MPGSGVTLLSCLLAESLIEGAHRISINSANYRYLRDDLYLGPIGSLPESIFNPDYTLDWTKPNHRAWFSDLINLSPDSSRFLVDVTSVSPTSRHQLITAVISDLSSMADVTGHFIDLLLLVKPDMASVYRGRNAIAEFCSLDIPHVRLTVVFNNAAGGYAQGDVEWERMWDNWPVRFVMQYAKRLHEIRLPVYSPRMIEGYMKCMLDLDAVVGVGVGLDTINIDVARWERALADIEDRFSFLLSRPAPELRS